MMKTNIESELDKISNRISLRNCILNESKDIFCRELSLNLTKKTNSTYSVLITANDREAYAKISVNNTANKSLTSNDIYDAMMSAISSACPDISSSGNLFDLVLYNENGFTIYV